MAGLCKVSIIGNLGGPPELRYTPNGTPILTFSVAVNRWSTTAEGERREETEWFRVSAWRKLGETYGPLLSKGSRVYVDGRLRTRGWVGQDGEKRTSLEVDASTIVLLDARQRGEPTEMGGEEHGGVDVDQIPF